MSVETSSSARPIAVRSQAGSMDGTLRWAGVILLAIIAGLLALQALHAPNDKIDPQTLRTPYQAVLLSNGLAYFGKVENSNSRFLTLSDVYYIQSRMSQGMKGSAPPPNVLVKRGKEWHAPDRMTINIQDVVFI